MEIDKERIIGVCNEALVEAANNAEQALAFASEEYWEYERGYIGAEECARNIRQYGVEVEVLTLREARMRNSCPAVTFNGNKHTLVKL